MIGIYNRGGELRWAFRASRLHPSDGGGERLAWSPGWRGTVPGGRSSCWREKGTSMRNVWTWAATVAALMLAAGMIAPSGAEEPGGPFPYAELAGLSAAVAPVRVVVGEATAVRLRPAHDWPVIAEVGVGRRLLATAVSGGRNAWLRVRLADGVEGWVDEASVGVPGTARKRLPVEWAPPITATGPYWGAEFYSWPSGPGVGYRIVGGPWGVAGRSIDSEWVAVRVAGLAPQVVWLRASEIELNTPDLSVADLPVFLGQETLVLPVGDPDGREAHTTRPAENWAWAAGDVVLGWSGDELWAHDPSSGELAIREATATRGLPSPDGRWLAATGCLRPDSCQPTTNLRFATSTADVTLVSLAGERSRVFFGVFGRLGTQREGEIMHGWGWPGRWSPDGQVLLVPSFHRSGRSGAEWTALTVDGGEYPVEVSWVESLVDAETRLCSVYAWSAGPDRTLIFEGMCDGMAHVFDLSGTLLRSEPRSGRHPDGAAFGLSEITSNVRVEWSPDRSLAIVTSGRGRAAWLYRAASQRAEPLDIPPGHEQSEWASSWSPDGEILALIDQLHSGCGAAYYKAVWLVEPGSGAARHVNLGWPAARICGTGIGWSADGEWWWIETHGASGAYREGVSVSEASYGTDGLVAPNGHAAQLRIYDRQGSLAHMFRTELESWDLAGTHRAAWSSDGRWLAIGGRDTGVWCRCGA